jgi:hypothetical protein
VIAELSPAASAVLRALAIAPGTPAGLAVETGLPLEVVEFALVQLWKAGRVEELRPGLWKAR